MWLNAKKKMPYPPDDAADKDDKDDKEVMSSELGLLVIGWHPAPPTNNLVGPGRS